MKDSDRPLSSEPDKKKMGVAGITLLTLFACCGLPSSYFGIYGALHGQLRIEQGFTQAFVPLPGNCIIHVVDTQENNSRHGEVFLGCDVQGDYVSGMVYWEDGEFWIHGAGLGDTNWKLYESEP